MRLTSITLTSYGNFDAEHIEFNPSPGVINLLMAPNGAGKSVLRNAFCDLLFGIGGQTPMGFRFPYSRMRVSADAVDRDGTPFAFGRRKGQGNTLVDGEGNTLDPVKLARLLGRTDRTLLERLFALDTERLRRGEDELFASNGALRDALLAGAGGFHQATQLRETLEAARDTLAPTRKASQRPFYIALEEFNESRKRINDHLLKPDLWARQETDLRETAKLREEQNRRADAASAEIARLERARRVAPWLAEHDEAASWLGAHPDAPNLNADLASHLAEARAKVVIAEERARREHELANQLGDQVQSIVLDGGLLASAANIDEVTQAAGAARKATSDLPAVQSELTARQLRIATLLRDLDSSLPLERAGEAIPPRAIIARARQMIAAYREYVAAVSDAQRRVADLRRNFDLISSQLDALPRAADTQMLAELIQEIRSDGDPAKRRQDLTTKMSEANSALSAAVARVPGWGRGAKALVDLAPLLPSAYDRLMADLAAARTEELSRRTQLEDCRQAVSESEERFRRMTTSGSLHSDSELIDARTHRDAGWNLVYRRAFTTDPPSTEEERQFASALPLPIAYERAVLAADGVADTRMENASAVAELDAALRAVEESRVRVAAAEQRHRIALEMCGAAERAWSQVCSVLPLGESPAVSEVHAFIVARERVIDAIKACELAGDALKALDEQQESWSARLSVLLTIPGEEHHPLPRLLSTARIRVEDAQKAAAEWTRAADRRDAAAEALAMEQTKLETATAELATWHERWNVLLTELGRPLGEGPEVTDELLQLMMDLRTDCDAATSLLARVQGMTADIERFNASLEPLTTSLIPASDALSPFEAVAELTRRLVHQRGLERQHAVLREQLEATQQKAEAARRELFDRQAELRATLLLIGGDSIDAAEARLALSADRSKYASQLAMAQTRLQEAGSGLSLDALGAEVAAVPLGEVESMIERASRERKEANDAAQEAAARASSLRQQMDREKIATEANIAAVERQAAIAKLGRVLDEALLMHVASVVLEKSLAKIETAGDSVLLRRISEFFRKLTDGVYSRVYTEVQDDNVPRLILQERAFPDERKAVRDLSEGTRDQLFLALRLAAIEEHAATAPPLPFIGDDILQTFDDERALAALRVLQELSKGVQVILLTHHRHILNLAASLPEGAVHVCALQQTLAA